MSSRCVDFVRGEVLDWVLVVPISFLLGNDQLHGAEFGEDISDKIVLRFVVFIVVFALLFVQAEGERVGRFVVSVVGVNDVLSLDSVAFGVIVEPADAGDEVPGFLVDRVVMNDVVIL